MTAPLAISPKASEQQTARALSKAGPSSVVACDDTWGCSPGGLIRVLENDLGARCASATRLLWCSSCSSVTWRIAPAATPLCGNGRSPDPDSGHHHLPHTRGAGPLGGRGRRCVVVVVPSPARTAARSPSSWREPAQPCPRRHRPRDRHLAGVRPEAPRKARGHPPGAQASRGVGGGPVLLHQQRPRLVGHASSADRQHPGTRDRPGWLDHHPAVRQERLRGHGAHPRAQDQRSGARPPAHSGGRQGRGLVQLPRRHLPGRRRLRGGRRVAVLLPQAGQRAEPLGGRDVGRAHSRPQPLRAPRQPRRRRSPSRGGAGRHARPGLHQPRRVRRGQATSALAHDRRSCP